MGRRKKKDNSKRRSLLFEESHVEGQQLPLSPVLCADNPVTAVSVRVDSNCSIPWISPQFDGITLTQGRRRRCRRRNISEENSRNRTRHNSSHRKYPALQFVGDVRSEKPVKRVARSGRLTEHLEDGHVSMVNEKISNSKSKYRISNDKRTVLSSDVNHDNIEGGHYGCVETVRRSSFRKSVDKHYRPSLARCSVYCGRLSDSPASSSHDSSVQRKRSKESSQHFTRLRSDFSASHLEDETSHEVRGDRRKAYDSDILLSPLEASNLSQSSRTTPAATGLIQIPVRMALFIHSPSEEAVNKSTSSSPQQCSNSQSKKCGHNVSSHHGTKSTRTRSRTTVKQGLSQCSLTVHQEGTLRRSKRLQDKLREALRYLQPGTPDQRHSSNILALDTPESEYGLTIKLRQRLKIKAKQ